MAETHNFFDLYTRTPSVQFGAAQAMAFEDMLQRRALASSLRPLTNVQELQLDADGRTVRGGARLSLTAFRRIAFLIATGLASFLPEVAGTVKTLKNDNDRVDARLARHTWNSLLEVRFSLISRYRLLCDRETNTIDGLAKAGYVPLLNADAYRAGKEALAAAKPTFRFYGGSVSNRAMAVWFREASPICQVAGRAFYRGYYLASGELSGFATRLTPAVFFPQGTCLAPFGKYGKKIHTVGGADERTRAATGFAEIAAKPFPNDVILPGLAKLDAVGLGFAATCDERLQQEPLRKIRKALVDRGVTRGAATEIARIALALGRDMHQPEDARIKAITTTYSGRTLLDLLVPLCKAARQTSLRRREVLEQAAFHILTGQLLAGGKGLSHGQAISIQEGEGAGERQRSTG